MFCPQCGTEAPANQQYCRKCGANLKMIGKAVALSESIARSDRGPLPKIKEMIKGFKLEQVAKDVHLPRLPLPPFGRSRVEQVTDEVSRALEQMNQEIVRGISVAKTKKELARKEKEARRRENHIVRGTISLFFGTALMIILYYLSRVIVLKIPPEDAAKIPFELEPLVRMLWIVGLLPAMTGLGRVIAGLLVRPVRPAIEIEQPEEIPMSAPPTAALPPTSVTENTTEFFEPVRKQPQTSARG